MSHVTTESDDEMMSRDSSGSPLTDEGVGGSNVLKKGPWTSAEDAILADYVNKHGEGNWNAVQRHSGLFRCGKSCRLRWANHLRPDLKKGAFTSEEERLIIELHAKMGNKWARMAANLPGRTDNEIKNYWNTRIKRRQRAGLPLYPPDICLLQMQESQLNQNCSGAGGQNGNMQPNSFEIPDIVFDSLKETQGLLPYIPEIPCISTNTMLMNTLNPSDYYGFVPPIVHRPKRLREATTSFFGYDSCGNTTSQRFGSSFPYDTTVSMANKNHSSFGEYQGCHSLENGKFSASNASLRTCKPELPSLQYPETDFSSWGSSSPPPAMCGSVDAFIQSPPPSGALHSPKNSGLLDALLHEAKTQSSKNNQLSQKSPDSLVADDMTNCSALDMSETKWEEYGDSISPLGNNSAASIFRDCTPLSFSGSSLEENPPSETLPGINIKSEAGEEVWPMEEEKKEHETQLDYSRPDALLGSCWFGRGFAYEDQVPKTDYISAHIHGNLGDGRKPMVGETAPNQGWGFGSCAWNTMPAVCQISNLP